MRRRAPPLHPFTFLLRTPTRPCLPRLRFRRKEPRLREAPLFYFNFFFCYAILFFLLCYFFVFFFVMLFFVFCFCFYKRLLFGQSGFVVPKNKG